jgi:uncharacterized phiE125 gp8 family phage protein
MILSEGAIAAGDVAAMRDAAKAFLRIGNGAEDAVMERLVLAALELCAAFTGRNPIRRTVIEQAPAGGAWVRLARAPVISIAGVERLLPDGSAAVLPAKDYAVDIDANGDGWVKAIGGGRVRVSYLAGFADDWAAVPEALRHGIVRLAAHLHTQRDGGAGAPPAAVTALWRPYRRVRI